MPKRKKNDSAKYKNDGDRLAMLRSHSVLSQNDFAKIIGVSLSSYQDYEVGKTAVPLAVRRAIWKLAPIEVNPLDQSESPREVRRQLHSLRPDQIDPRMISKAKPKKKIVRKKLAQDESPVTVVPESRPKVTAQLVEIRTRYFEYRDSLPPFGRNYLEVRNWIMLTALHYIILKFASLQLGFRFGASADQTDYPLFISFGIVAVLLVAFIQSASHAFRGGQPQT